MDAKITWNQSSSSDVESQRVELFLDNNKINTAELLPTSTEVIFNTVPETGSKLKVYHTVANQILRSEPTVVEINTPQKPAPITNLTLELLSLPSFTPSDELIRLIFNTAHFFLDQQKFPEYNVPGADTALQVVGPKFYFTNARESAYGADADPLEGLATPPKLHARDRYYQLMDAYKAKYPNCLMGTYSGSVGLKKKTTILDIGAFPADGFLIDHFKPEWILPWNPGLWKVDGQVDIRIPEARDKTIEVMINIGLGRERGNRKFDIMHFDEVGYVAGFWEDNVIRFQEVKRNLNNNGVLLSINVGGWGWSYPYNNVGPNVLDDIISMTNSVELEGPWTRWESTVSPYGFRTAQHTTNIINNFRKAMSAGVCLEMIPVQDGLRANKITIISITETTDGLLLILNRPHYTFPTGGPVYEKISLANMPNRLKFLENYAYTPTAVVNQPNSVLLNCRGNTINTIKEDNNFTGNITFLTGETGTYIDRQANTRVTVGLALMARNPGDHVVVYDGVYGGPQLGNGNPNNIDCWWWWPKLLGEPIEDYKIESVTSDSYAGVIKMSRQFKYGYLELYPVDGYTKVIMR